ncbi:MAG: hypothetical protein M1837_006301 [Sclerophora amabilis]|nr:MAG: hypothetical protein M1837_006301 [Sclerophora amabilis]
MAHKILNKELLTHYLENKWRTFSGIIKDSYKQARHDDDLNQPLSVQPWGTDGDRRRYWLIEGQDDTHFRLFRESSSKVKNNTWWSVAGSIEDLRIIAQQLQDEGSQAARRLSERILTAIPRFEATEEKRKRREYRIARKAQFSRPEPGFSLYEGRTRGKKIRYTYSSDEDEGSDATSTRRSARQSGVDTPKEDPEGPVFTASGRQVKARQGGAYGETTRSNQNGSNSEPVVNNSSDLIENLEVEGGRSRRSGLRGEVNGWHQGGDHIAGYNSLDEMEDEEDAASSGADEYAADGDDDNDNAMDDLVDDEGLVSDDDTDPELAKEHSDSLVVRLRYVKKPNEGLEPSSATQSNTKPEDVSPLLPNGHQKSSRNTIGQHESPEAEASRDVRSATQNGSLQAVDGF